MKTDSMKFIELCKSYSIIFAMFLLCITSSCCAQSCKDIPTTFSSYQEAKSLIRNAKFTLIDQISTPKSSWIRGAKYYSCDGNTGFFLMVTKNGKEYLFQSMPIDIWKGFKDALSFGDYYNKNIRSKFQLQLHR